jgi:ribonuclease J
MQTKTKQHHTQDESLQIIPLGGQEEVGRNMAVIEYGKDIVIIDMGLQFPEENMPGIDYIIPNVSYLKGKERNIRGVIFTHGHLDHIGAAPLLLERLGYPLCIGRKFTLALVKYRLDDHKKNSSKRLKSIELQSTNEKINLGAFNVEFFDVEHSIIDAIGVILKTPAGTIIHTGDWTLGTLANEKPIFYHHLSRLPRPTILMMESLGSTSDKPLITEKEMWQNLRKIIDNAPGRIIIATFSTQIKRVRDIIQHAEQTGKKVVMEGYSMKTNIQLAKNLGYIKAHENTIVDIKKIKDIPENKIIIVCTGAQGETRAVLSRIVSGNHRSIKLKKNDTVIFSSSVIPGNERSIQHLKDSLYRQCDNVYHSEIVDIHVSGHNNIEAIKKLIKQIKPSYVVPVYANYYMLKEAQKIIAQTGFVAKKDIFVLDNGHIINFNKNKKPFIERNKANTSYVFIDGLGVTDLEAVVLRDRKALANDGIFVIIAVIDSKTGKVITSPDVISRGFVYLEDSKELLKRARKKTIDIIEKSAGSGKSISWSYVKNNLRDKLGNFFYQETKKRPMILPVIIEV